MSDWFYDTLVAVGRPAFWVSSRPTVIGASVTERPGPFILAATHGSPYDVPVLMRHCRRRIDFVSITELFQNPMTAALFRGMNAFPLERRRADPATVRVMLDRLKAGRVVGMFPEGGIRTGAASVLRSGAIRPGLGRLAVLARVPVVPCVIVGVEAYGRLWSWLPTRGVRYGIAFGEAIPSSDGAAEVERRVVEAILRLHAQLEETLVPSPV